MSRQQPPPAERNEIAPETRDSGHGDRPDHSEAPFGRPRGDVAEGNQHDLSGGEHATDSATTYHAPPDPPRDET